MKVIVIKFHCAFHNAENIFNKFRNAEVRRNSCEEENSFAHILLKLFVLVFGVCCEHIWKPEIFRIILPSGFIQ